MTRNSLSYTSHLNVMDFFLWRLPKYSTGKFYVDNIIHKCFASTISKSHSRVSDNFRSMKAFNDTHMEKLCFLFNSVQNSWLVTSELFVMFRQSNKFYYILYYHVLRVHMFEKGDSSTRQEKWMPAPSSKIYGETWVGFCFNTGKRFFLEVSF